MRAVRFDDYGDEGVLEVREVEDPVAVEGRVVIRVKASVINPGEMTIRSGAMAEVFPTTFPSGQGSDLAGEVVELGEVVDAFAVGDAVLGWTDERAAQAELASVPVEQIVAKPETVPW